MRRPLKAMLLACVFLCAVACDDSRKMWTEILKKCATSDTIGNDMIYFGASNTLGPGTIWRQKQDGSYTPDWRVSDVFPNQADRDAFLHENNPADCKGTSSVSWEVKGDLPFQGGSTPISGELSADLKKASTVAVKVGTWKLIYLVEGPWKQKFAALPDSPMKQDILAANRYLAETSVQVQDLTTTFTFSTDVATTLKVKYPNGTTIKIGGDGLSLQVNWTSDTTLEMHSPGQFYIMSDYSKLEHGAPTILNAENAGAQLKLSHIRFDHPDKIKTAPREDHGTKAK